MIPFFLFEDHSMVPDFKKIRVRKIPPGIGLATLICGA